MSLEVSLSLQFFKRVLEGQTLLFSKCLIEFSCEAIWSWAFVFLWRFFITASISVLVIGLLIISVSSWLSLGRLCLYEHLSVSSRFFRFICIQWFAVAAYGPLYFSPLWLLWGICCDVWASLVVMCGLYSVRARELQCLGSLVVTHGILAPPALGA